MPYDLFPSVDENYNFPEEVRTQLAKSEQLRNLVVPMSQAVRDALSENELWFGRTIFNTTSKKIESWTAPGSWVEYLDDSYEFPQPPPFWDENYDVLPQVRAKLAKSEQLRNMVTPMTETARNSLPINEKWHGRIIFNTTTKKVQIWFDTSQSWFSVLDEDYVPVQPSWRDWEPLLGYLYSAYVPNNFIGSGRAISTDSVSHYMFNIEFTGDIGSAPGNSSLVIPADRKAAIWAEDTTSSQDKLVGSLMIDYRTSGGSLVSGVISLRSNYTTEDQYPFGVFILYYNNNGEYQELKANSPGELRGGCKISGKISYECDQFSNY